MDEIHAVLELFVSCRGSGWPLVSTEAVQQLLMQHLLMAAPMDKDEVVDMIKTCFEADNNGEINFLSFWAGMENLLELLGLRDQGTLADDKVYGLQVFRNGLLAEALRKQEGPTSGVLLTRDEVLQIIHRTNQAVMSRHGADISGTRCPQGGGTRGEAQSSSPFWDEVYRETEQLDPNSVLSISELSMMVFGFLKTYIQEESQARELEHRSQSKEDSGFHDKAAPAALAITSGSSSVLLEREIAAHDPPSVSRSRGAGGRQDEERRRISERAGGIPQEVTHSLSTGSGAFPTAPWQREPEDDKLDRRWQGQPGRGSSGLEAARTSSHSGGVDNFLLQEVAEPSHADAAAFLKAFRGDYEDPSAQLRQMLLAAGKITEDTSLSKKAMQELRYLNAAAIDCLDRISMEHEKRNDEMSDAVVSLRRMRTEKQQLVERLTSLEHQHSQLQLQHEQQKCDRGQLDQLQVTVNSERQQKELAQNMLRVEKMLWCYCCASLYAGRVTQNEDFTRRLATAQNEQKSLAADYRKKMDALISEKETLEEQLRAAEDAERAAQAAREQLQGDAESTSSAFQRRIREMEEDKRRYEAEAEENDTLIAQLQGRLEEKVQQVAILEVKNKQQLRLLHQVRTVRNSLMQLLQETKGKEGDGSGSVGGSAAAAQQSPDVAKLKAGLKTAQAHIKELETFIEEMRKDQRRAAHPRYELPAAGDSSAPSTQRWQVRRPASLPLRALPTLGAELEMSASVPSPKALPEGLNRSDGGRLNNTAVSLAQQAPGTLSDQVYERGSVGLSAKIGGLNQQDPERKGIAGEEKKSDALFTAADADEPHGTLLPQAARRSHGGDSESSDPRHRQLTGRMTNSRVTSSFASMRSEPSTSDAISKEPTSCTSLAEVDCMFGRRQRLLQLLWTNQVALLSACAWFRSPGRKSRRSHSPQASKRTSSLSGASAVPVHDSPRAEFHGLEMSGIAASSPQLPALDVLKDVASPTDRANSALEVLLGGKRRISRRPSDSSTAQQQRASAASSSVLSLPDLSEELAGGPFREETFLSDSRSSATSDGSFLMLSTPSPSATSAAEASSSKSKAKPHRLLPQELASRPLDATTLSGMFGMLGACASLPQQAADRGLREADSGERESRMVRNADERQDSGKGTPKSRGKQPAVRLSAAAAAAMSSRNASGFRSLRRISQGNEQSDVHQKDAEAPTAAWTDDSPTRARASAADPSLSARSETSAFLTSAAESATSGVKSNPGPEAARTRARRTVSRGLSEPMAKSESSQPHLTPMGKPQHRDADHSFSHFRPSAADGHTASEPPVKGESTLALAPIGDRHSRDARSEEDSAESGGAGTSRRSRYGNSGEQKDASGRDACRSGESSYCKRNARSRSSSSDTSLQRRPSPRGSTASQGQHASQTSNRNSESKEAGKRRESHGTSNASQRIDSRGADLVTVSQPVSEATSHRGKADTKTSDVMGGVVPGTEQHGQRTLHCTAVTNRLNQVPSMEAPPGQQLQQALGQERAKLQDDQTASAAALLAAAAGVVDASLQQQQQMIQRQQEHHEDLQRAQQRRIDMLQEQLDFLQRSKEQQRESGELQQKQMIESLQAKLEELQRRQEQRDHAFQEAQRKLLQEELEVQFKQKFAELQSSSRSTGLDVSGGYVNGDEYSAARPQKVGTQIRGGTHGEVSYPALISAGGEAAGAFRDEANGQAQHHQEANRSAVPGVHVPPQKPSGGSVLSVLPNLNRRHDEDASSATSWHGTEVEQFGVHAQPEYQHVAGPCKQRLMDRATSRIGDRGEVSGESDGTSSCASSSIMGSQYSVIGQRNLVEDLPTTSSSPFLSQVATPGAPSSLRSGHFSVALKLEPQLLTVRGDRLTPQLLQAHSMASAQHGGSRLRHQPSEATRVIPLPQTSVDSARFLGNSTSNERGVGRSESFRLNPGMLSLQESPMKGPPASARSLASTASYATAPPQKMSLPKTSRVLQGSKNDTRSTTSRRHTDSRNSQSASTKRSGHGSCSERQLPPSPGRPSSQSGWRHKKSPASTSGRESLISGSRRTVNSLMSKLPSSATFEDHSPRQKESFASCTVDNDHPSKSHREPFRVERSEASEAAAAYCRRSATNETLPESELSRSSSRRHNARVGSSRKSKADGGTELEEDVNATKSSRDSKSSSSLALDWFKSGSAREGRRPDSNAQSWFLKYHLSHEN
ncbi:hypothetical protein Efla_003743 [Eimeria flavescens]